MKFIPWPGATSIPREVIPQPDIGTPKNADGSVNYGYVQGGAWWNRPGMSQCARGFVRDERFGRGSDTVIKGTNRAKTRASRALVDRERDYKAKAASE